MTRHAAPAMPEKPFGGISFLHTSHGHVATFGTLMTQLAPEIPVRHVVAEPLLAAARHADGVTPDLARRAHEAIQALAGSGARVVVCTCTTLGECVDQVMADEQAVSLPGLSEGAQRSVLQRVDRAAVRAACEMAEDHIYVAACLKTTLAPTLGLIKEEAASLGKTVRVTPILMPEVWTLFEKGHHSAYLRKIAEKIEQAAPDGGVILLNQASMAGAAKLLSADRYLTMSSPQSGVQAAIDAWRKLSGVVVS